MRAADLLPRFLLPLVRGARVLVGAPLGAPGVEELLRLAEGSPEHEAIAEARERTAAALVARPPRLTLDGEALRLAVAAHDMLFLLHPGARGLLVRRGRLQQVAEEAAALADLPETSSVARLLARHTVLWALPRLKRRDARISFWAGHEEFRGMEVPQHLLVLPRLRRVRDERWQTDVLDEAAQHPLAQVVVGALLGASPMTDALNPLRGRPLFRLGALAALPAPELLRAVAYDYLEQGLERIGPPLASSLVAELQTVDARRARLLLAFLSHLHVCWLLSPGPASAQLPSPFPSGDPRSRDFLGLLAAVRAVAPELAAPPDLDAVPGLADRLAAHAAACLALCGRPRVAELSALVAGALSRTPALLAAPRPALAAPSPAPEPTVP